ncbi:MAG: hypothetical protein ACOYXW_08730 [Actinomycetota bacterium]
MDAVIDGDGPVLSVYVQAPEPDEPIDAVVYRLCAEADLPHRKVQVSFVERLTEQGFRITHEVSDGEVWSHHHVHFDEPVTESQVQRFINCFDEPIANPTGGKRRLR